VSDLFPNGSQHVWMRVTGLTAGVSAALDDLVRRLPGSTLEVLPREQTDEAAWSVTVQTALTAQHEWAGRARYAEFIQQAWRRPSDGLRLEFATPTSIKSVGVYRPFPQPGLVFRLLYERWQKLEAAPLPFQPEPTALETFAEHWLAVTDYAMQCSQHPQKQGQTLAFKGWMQLALLQSNADFRKRAEKRGDPGLLALERDIRDHLAQYAALVNFLAAFAFYSGVGSYTAHGQGMVRVIAHDGR
jgi:CRISPR/Cas system endoribonuclease Cas6 (RAMP superfamily)